MLNRMVELAGRSANGTMSPIDKQAMQDEVNQLCDEIDRIAESTDFNKINLLDASLNITLQIGDTSGQVLPVTLAEPTVDTILTGIPDITADDASNRIDTIRDAINTISPPRGVTSARCRTALSTRSTTSMPPPRT